MFIFVKSFLRRGYTTVFSYLSWQVPASRFRRLMDLILVAFVFLLAIGIIL